MLMMMMMKISTNKCHTFVALVRFMKDEDDDDDDDEV